VTPAAQTISFGTAPSVVVDGTGTVSATGGASGNPVTFTSTTTGVCRVSDTNGVTVTGVTVGTCTIAANQDGNSNYNAAPQVTQDITVGKGNQTIGAITFNPTTLSVGGVTTASATGGASGNPVTFTSTTTGVCTVSGTNGVTVTGVTAGTCTIAADQDGNSNYNAAPQVTQDITVPCPATVVTTTADSGAGSLRQIIADACPNSTITFASDLAVQLTSDELAIDKNLTIDGTGHIVSVNGPGVSCTTCFRVFRVITDTANFTLRNLTVANGSGSIGGGLFNFGIATLINTTFSGN